MSEAYVPNVTLLRCIAAQANLGDSTVPHLDEGAYDNCIALDHKGCEKDAQDYSDAGFGPNLLLWNGTCHKLVFQLKDDG